MTCAKNCRDCIYGVPKATVKCNNPNATCNGSCYRCPWASDQIVKYICTSGMAYGRGESR